MAKTQSGSVSVWQWLGIFIALSIPFAPFILVPVLACIGENQSRKNLFRAHLIIWGLIALISVAWWFGLSDQAHRELLLKELQQWWSGLMKRFQ
jgi:hypothetical protein